MPLNSIGNYYNLNDNTNNIIIQSFTHDSLIVYKILPELNAFRSTVLFKHSIKGITIEIKSSPNQEFVAASLQSPGGFRIYRQNNGLLTPFVAHDSLTSQFISFSFSPNNKSLYFSGYDDKGTNIYVLTNILDTANPVVKKLYTFNGVFSAFAFSLGVDGRLYFITNNILGTINCPNDSEIANVEYPFITLDSFSGAFKLPIQNQYFFVNADKLQIRSQQESGCKLAPYQLMAYGAGLSDFSWEPQPGLTNGNSQNATFLPPGPGEYVLNVTGNSACTTATAQVRINVTAEDFEANQLNEACRIEYLPELTFPNVITPNGDGFNDAFTIGNLEFYPPGSLRIINRWGQEVFSSDAYRNLDGAFTGAGLPAGTYFYLYSGSSTVRGLVQVVR